MNDNDIINYSMCIYIILNIFYTIKYSNTAQTLKHHVLSYYKQMYIYVIYQH